MCMKKKHLGIIVKETISAGKWKTNPEREKITKEEFIMKSFMENGVPVPRRGKLILIIAGILLMTASAAAGIMMAPEKTEIPVALAGGEVITPPWYITIDGEKVALVKSQEAAQEAVGDIIEEYRDGDGVILDIEVKEDTATEKMNIKNGDEAPDILTVAEAKKLLKEGKDGESYLTVVTTGEETEREPIEFTQEYKPEPDMYVGEKKVETEGREGTKEVTKKVVRENGQQIKEEILEEEILEEPREEIVLTGTKNYDGYGGGTGNYRGDNVSYDPEAVYETLRTPVDNIYISSGFGQRWGRLHSGTDFALAQGNAIYAADDGVVYFSGTCGGYGNLVKIDHGNGMQTYYAHCSQLLVSQGQHVSRGEKIALVGSTGNSTGPHLHFEVIINGSCVDPEDFLDL